MEPLLTILESIQQTELQTAFVKFIMEATPRSYEPSNDKIKKSIKKRKYVGIYYEEETNDQLVLPGFRLIEPLVFGKGYRSADDHISHKNEFYLRGYVIMESKKAENKELHKINRKSVSKSKRVPYFRLFKVERITMWEELRFTIPKARDLYNPDDSMIAEIMQAIRFEK